MLGRLEGERADPLPYQGVAIIGRFVVVAVQLLEVAHDGRFALPVEDKAVVAGFQARAGVLPPHRQAHDVAELIERDGFLFAERDAENFHQ